MTRLEKLKRAFDDCSEVLEETDHEQIKQELADACDNITVAINAMEMTEDC